MNNRNVVTLLVEGPVDATVAKYVMDAAGLPSNLVDIMKQGAESTLREVHSDPCFPRDEKRQFYAESEYQTTRSIDEYSPDEWTIGAIEACQNTNG